MRSFFALLLLLPSISAAERYQLIDAPTKATSVVESVTITRDGQWLSLAARKRDGRQFQVWVENPEAPRRYLLREGDGKAVEYRNAVDGSAVVPSAVSLATLLPAADGTYLGHRYRRVADAEERFALPADIRIVELHPDLLIGPNSNARPKDNFRRWDGSDYAMVPFTRDDYRMLADAGVTCVQVDDRQAAWADELGLYYWGGGSQLPFPEMLYRSQYLGPALYLDEPAVSTRDHVLRPRLAKDEGFRKSIRPGDAVAAFTKYFDENLGQGAPARLQKVLAGRQDVDLGTLKLEQQNLYSWETMVDTAAFELTRKPGVPEAFVWEPAGRVGSHRTLPELNMSMGTQFTAGDTGALAELVYAFLRGAARLAGKHWGVSIYGAVERADAPYLLTRAYDLGATRFHFWDNYQLAAVPVEEYLAFTRHLRNHASNHPRRDLDRLRRAAEVAITLPAGYGIGHTNFGRGNLWGLPELNLERRNEAGVPYRAVMSRFFQEAERLIRAGVPFDAMWDLPGHPPLGYREVIRIGEDGAGERRAEPKPGESPRMTVDVRGSTAVARIKETTAPVYFTHGTDLHGRYPNAKVLWELYGPEDPDYRTLIPDDFRPVTRAAGTAIEVEMKLPLERPGVYRLRAATVDVSGRSTVVWRSFERLQDGSVKLLD